MVTLAEHYGIPRDETVTDAEWLVECGSRGWAAIKADANIRRRPGAERQALVEARVRTFLLGGQLTTEQKVARVLDNLPAISRACARPGPFVYRVHPDRLQLLSIRRA